MNTLTEKMDFKSSVGPDEIDLDGIYVDEYVESVETEKDFFEEKFIDVEILGRPYLLKILKIHSVMKHTDICKYLNLTGCAFVDFHGEPVIAVDIRDENANIENKNIEIIIAEVILNPDYSMLLGFVVGKIDDFLCKVF